MSKEFKFPTEEWQQIKLVEAIAKRDEEWLRELRRWHGEWRKETKHFSPTLSTCIEHMRQWAKGEE